ncbi:MAG: hypothetical protein PVJ57_20065 [Phycisphaerae bacterium]|jgi:hypothetical protein
MTRCLTRAPRDGALSPVGLCALLLCAAILAVPVCATHPREPLAPPVFSFDHDSPTVIAGIVSAGDLLMPDPEGSHPMIVVPAINLGLISPLDHVDAISLDASLLHSGERYGLLLSVTRVTVGGPPPEPMLSALGLPFNVTDQAERGHAAGDQFMSTILFDPGKRGVLRGGPQNNILNRNNYDEGGTDFDGQPPTHAHDSVGSVPQDNVDGTGTPPAGRHGGFPEPIENVFFSLTAQSPSLDILPAPDPSGANVYFNPTPQLPSETRLFASCYDLGLQVVDDIDAMIVDDQDLDGCFDPEDCVLFSLAPGSPSLYTIPGASQLNPAADVFIARLYEPATLFTPAESLGLQLPPDDVDALDLYACDEPIACAEAHGILALAGDLNCDTAINNFDISAFVLVLTSSPPDYPEYYARYPDCWHLLADINGDGAVDNFDISPFVSLLLGP